MFKTLDIHPALGFEFFDRWSVAVHQRDEQLRQDRRDPRIYRHRLWGRVRMYVNNISKVIAYIPGANKVVGIMRIVIILQDETTNRDKRAINAKHIYRGVAEICLGHWLIIFDVIQTLRDYHLVQSYERMHPHINLVHP